MVKNHEECKYYLPCGWCDKNNEKCIFEQQCEAPKKEETTTPPTEYNFDKCSNKPCIEHEWICSGADTGGWMYTCKKCFATKRENYQTFPSVNPLWINPNAPDINKVGDFPPYYDVTCVNGVANTSEVTAQAFINEVKSGKLPEIPKDKENKK
jgi:hypothetical protein